MHPPFQSRQHQKLLYLQSLSIYKSFWILIHKASGYFWKVIDSYLIIICHSRLFPHIIIIFFLKCREYMFRDSYPNIFCHNKVISYLQVVSKKHINQVTYLRKIKIMCRSIHKHKIVRENIKTPVRWHSKPIQHRLEGH
jgi:hypothetical protein